MKLTHTKPNSKILKRIIAKRCFNSPPSPKCSSSFPELVFNLGLLLWIRDNTGSTQATSARIWSWDHPRETKGILTQGRVTAGSGIFHPHSQSPCDRWAGVWGTPVPRQRGSRGGEAELTDDWD